MCVLNQPIHTSHHIAAPCFNESCQQTLLQRCNEVCDIALIDLNGVAPKWVATPFSSDSIFSNENYLASVIAALTQLILTLGVNGLLV